MSNPSGPDQPDEAADEVADAADEVAAQETETPTQSGTEGDAATEVMEVDAEHEPATEIMAPADPSSVREPRNPLHPSLFRREATRPSRHGPGAAGAGWWPCCW
jgi:hypothetical protein